MNAKVCACSCALTVVIKRSSAYSAWPAYHGFRGRHDKANNYGGNGGCYYTDWMVAPRAGSVSRLRSTPRLRPATRLRFTWLRSTRLCSAGYWNALASVSRHASPGICHPCCSRLQYSRPGSGFGGEPSRWPSDRWPRGSGYRQRDGLNDRCATAGLRASGSRLRRISTAAAGVWWVSGEVKGRRH